MLYEENTKDPLNLLKLLLAQKYCEKVMLSSCARVQLLLSCL